MAGGVMIFDGGAVVDVPVAEPPPQLAPAPPLPIVASAPVPILPPGQVYFDLGDNTFVGSVTHDVVSAPPVEAPGAPLDDFAQAQADALANEPGLSDLPPWELEDPFALQFDALANPPLKGGGAADAIGQACSDYGVDPLACFANALHEGSGGGIGDTGTAYGPFQIHATDGRLPQFKGRGPSSTAVNAWAWSENGLRYAVRSMVNGKPSARGLRGHAAVYAIVYGFERPGDERRQYDLRAAEYDHLAALGAGWAEYVASKLAGPQAGGATDTKPIGKPKPAVPVYVPAGVNAQWRNLLDVFSGSVPREHAKLQSFGLTLTEVFK